MIHLLSFHYTKSQKNSKTPCARLHFRRTVAVYVPGGNLDARKARNLILSI